jgi:chromosome segregation ATPase
LSRTERGTKSIDRIPSHEGNEMSVITEILDRLSGVEIVKDRLRETATRLDQWTTQVVALDRQVQDIDRRLVRIETLAELAQANAKGPRRLPRPE